MNYYYFYSSSNLSMILLIGICVLFIVLYKNTKLVQKINDVASFITNSYLVRRFPIHSLDGDGGEPIPTCPYRWPNGQGDISKFLEGERNRQLWGKRYGRLYRIWSGFNTEIVLSDPTDVQIVFKDSDKHTKAVNNNSGWLMGKLLGKCLGLISGEKYRLLKAATYSHFAHKRAPTYLARISRMTNDHFRSLDSESKACGIRTINPVSDLKLLSFFIVADIIYGELSPKLKGQLESLIAIRESLWDRMIQGGAATRYGWAKYMPTKTTKDLAVFKSSWARFNDEAHEACLTSTSTEEEEEESAIVSMYREVLSGRTSRDEVLQTIDEMIFANLDVTIGGISWNLLFLAANQDVQSEVRHEIHTARARTSTDCNKWDHYIQSPSTMLAASIMESSRLKPLAAFSVPQSAPTDRVVAGRYLIPAGTSFIVDTHALNIENPYWGPDRETYRPSRFLGKKSTEMRYQFWRFGFGPRQCLGKFVVDVMIRVIVAHLVENYRLSLSDDTRWDKNPATWILHPDTNVLCENLNINTSSKDMA